MFGWLKSNPLKKLQKQHADLLGRAVDFQRKGDLQTYSQMMAEAEKLEKQMDAMEQIKTV
ncbi:MAG: DUF6435 family protein [Fuerstiella sp.]